MSDLVTGSTALSIELSAARARIEALEAALTKLKDKINYRLNNYLCDMKPNYDDSITGFNEAWDVVRAILKEESSAAWREAEKGDRDA